MRQQHKRQKQPVSPRPSVWIDFFGPGTNLEVRHVPNYLRLRQRLEQLRRLRPDLLVVLTSGSFDMKHIGHDRYLAQARALGDLLVVGVDGDERIRAKKGPNRPIYPHNERVEGLCALRCVDLVVIKRAGDRQWELIKTVRPDILVVSERTEYTKAELRSLQRFCGYVVELKSQAKTSTSAKVRLLVLGFADRIKKQVHELATSIDELVDNF